MNVNPLYVQQLPRQRTIKAFEKDSLYSELFEYFLLQNQPASTICNRIEIRSFQWRRVGTMKR